ncbi:acetyl esterase/lipase [Friedmanniella endophytica]|uniref:Acetyl esterase/lipase n=1 Tax=Microlunatus kandeliicorticis TaxID=1759536 RepID=A0A7W3IU00_9ACTN|nr:prolyl oligopeptidase family serine peptidase [Microlunatus kandeliicorticis]MBA8795183.1 acetyl esterase/lipase [Microlunatus kandeliicorticis]
MPTRRQLLAATARLGVVAGAGTGLAGGLLGLSACGADSPAAAPAPDGTVRVAYGSDPSQFAELSLPGPGPTASSVPAGLPVVVVVHGGYWSTGYGLELGRPLAADLVRAGVAVWNVEYRRVGEGPGGGGGWPATGDDVAAALDALAGSAVVTAARRAGVSLDLARVVGLGHSAGGQLVGWLAARSGGSGGASGGRGTGGQVRLRGAVSQAGVLDLVEAARLGLGGGAVESLLGGTPDSRPRAYAGASPTARVPIRVPVCCVHGTDDDVVPISQSERFVAADRAAGGTAELRRVPGGHFEQITVGTPAWATCRAATLRLLG